MEILSRCVECFYEILKEREHVGDPGVDGRIILMWGNLLRLAQGFGEEF